MSVHEFYRLKALITSTLEQVITSVVQKKKQYLWAKLQGLLEKQDRGSGIEDQLKKTWK